MSAAEPGLVLLFPQSNQRPKLRKSTRQLVAVHGICAIGPLALLPHFPIHLTAGKSGEILTGRLQKQVV
jgi:hypothetical protein